MTTKNHRPAIDDSVFLFWWPVKYFRFFLYSDAASRTSASACQWPGLCLWVEGTVQVGRFVFFTRGPLFFGLPLGCRQRGNSTSIVDKCRPVLSPLTSKNAPSACGSVRRRFIFVKLSNPDNPHRLNHIKSSHLYRISGFLLGVGWPVCEYRAPPQPKEHSDIAGEKHQPKVPSFETFLMNRKRAMHSRHERRRTREKGFTRNWIGMRSTRRRGRVRFWWPEQCTGRDPTDTHAHAPIRESLGVRWVQPRRMCRHSTERHCFWPIQEHACDHRQRLPNRPTTSIDSHGHAPIARYRDVRLGLHRHACARPRGVGWHEATGGSSYGRPVPPWCMRARPA